MGMIIAQIVGFTPVVLADSPVKVVVSSAIVINGAPNPTNIPSYQSKITVADVALDKITRFGTALQFEFQDSAGNSVNVTNFKATKADHTLVKTGGIVWSNTPLGSYHPDGQGSPDYHVFNADGVDVTPTSGFVAGYLGDDSGTLIPIISKFQLTDQAVTLGVPTRPLLTAVGQYYSLSYNWVFSYTYNGVVYTRTLAPSETEASVRVVKGLSEFVGEDPPQPCMVELQISDNLVVWSSSGVFIPDPRPELAPNIIALFPKTTTWGSPLRRFLRYHQTTIPALP